MKKNSGQVIVEYVLLLVVSTALALILVRFISVSDQNIIFFRYWENLLIEIGRDISS